MISLNWHARSAQRKMCMFKDSVLLRKTSCASGGLSRLRRSIYFSGFLFVCLFVCLFISETAKAQLCCTISPIFSMSLSSTFEMIICFSLQDGCAMGEACCKNKKTTQEPGEEEVRNIGWSVWNPYSPWGWCTLGAVAKFRWLAWLGAPPAGPALWNYPAPPYSRRINTICQKGSAWRVLPTFEY